MGPFLRRTRRRCGSKTIRGAVTDASPSVGLRLANVSRSGTRRLAGGASPEQLRHARRSRTPGPQRTHDRAATAGTRMPQRALLEPFLGPATLRFALEEH